MRLFESKKALDQAPKALNCQLWLMHLSEISNHLIVFIVDDKIEDIVMHEVVVDREDIVLHINSLNIFFRCY